MENTVAKPSTFSVGLKWGLISTLIHIIVFLALSLLGGDPFNEIVGYVSLLVVTPLIYVFAHKAFKDAGDGFMTYGEGVLIALFISIVGVIISFVFTYAYVNFVDTALMETYFQHQAEKMSEKKMTDQQVEMAMTWSRKLFWPLYVPVGVFLGLIVGLIVTIFTHKKNPEPTF
jgi:large-conductance mechanosensitive channel